MKRKAFVRFITVVLLAALAALSLTSCGASEKAASLPGSGKDYAYSDYEAVDNAAPDAYGSRGAEQVNVVGSSEIRHKIRNGSMNLTVKNTRETVKTIQGISSAAGGVISGSYIYEMREGLYAANITLRVPVTQFDAIMDQLQELGKAAEINQNEDDVTMQYLDLESRIKNLNAQEERLREILEMANTVEDVLAVERELSRVRGEIEVMTTHFTYLQDQVSYSTINLYIREEYIATQNISPAPFENLGARMREALVRSVNFIMAVFAGLLIAFSTMLPVLFILALFIFIIWRLIARAAKRKTPAA
jgi:hypothetical protein